MNKDEQKQLLIEAYKFALNSPDPSTQNGAVLVPHALQRHGVHGINEFPYGVEYSDERWERPAKYQWIEHAERNAIFYAARMGIPTHGAIMVACWSACSDCARAIVMSGIRTLVRHSPPEVSKNDRWVESIAIGDIIMQEGGVNIIEYTDSIPEAPRVLRDGKGWQP